MQTLAEKGFQADKQRVDDAQQLVSQMMVVVQAHQASAAQNEVNVRKAAAAEVEEAKAKAAVAVEEAQQKAKSQHLAQQPPQHLARQPPQHLAQQHQQPYAGMMQPYGGYAYHQQHQYPHQYPQQHPQVCVCVCVCACVCECIGRMLVYVYSCRSTSHTSRPRSHTTNSTSNRATQWATEPISI
jgi:hypothetical protein